MPISRENRLGTCEVRLAKPKQKAAKWEPANKDVVAPYVFLLKDAGLRRSHFDRVLAELAANKSAKRAELLSIASQYCGFPLRPRSRNDSLAVIKTRFEELVRFEGK